MGENNDANRKWCEGRHLRWAPVVEGDVVPFRGGRGRNEAAAEGSADALRSADEEPTENRRVTAAVFCNGRLWDVEIELPEPELFDSQEEYLASCIALIEIGVEAGVRQSS